MIDILSRSRLRGTFDDLSILLVAAIWGSTYVVMQDVGRDVPAAAFLMFRFIWALPALALPALKTLPRITRSEVNTGIFFGTLLFGILLMETIGVRHTSAANSGFLITVSVVLIPLLERVISKRRQLPAVYLTTAVALIGCGLLLLAHGTRPQSGDLIILGAAMIRATQITLFGRQTRGAQQSLVNLSVIEFITVAGLAGLVSALSGVSPWAAATAVSPHDWLLIAYLGILGTSFAFFAQLRAARAASSTRVGLILSTEPVFSTVFAVTAAGDSLGVAQIFGGVLIVLSAAVGRSFEGRNPARREPSRTPLGVQSALTAPTATTLPKQSSHTEQLASSDAPHT